MIKKELETSVLLAATPEFIARRILLIRGQKVMLDSDLAELYRVSTKNLNKAVRRNPDRFPHDFMFQLSKEELDNWKSHIATSNPAVKMGVRKRPYAFTEHGTIMAELIAPPAETKPKRRIGFGRQQE